MSERTPPSWLGTAEDVIVDPADLAVVDATCHCGQPIRAFAEVDSDDAITRMGHWWHPGAGCAFPTPNRRIEWNTAELQEDFTLLGFADLHHVEVIRKQDNKRGTLMFYLQPGIYFGWQEESSQ